MNYVCFYRSSSSSLYSARFKFELFATLYITRFLSDSIFETTSPAFSRFFWASTDSMMIFPFPSCELITRPLLGISSDCSFFLGLIEVLLGLEFLLI